MTDARTSIPATPDGSDPCICCAIEVRDLLATAHNFLGAWERNEGPQLIRKLAEFRESYDRLNRACDAHFADSMHSHGRVNKRPTDAD